MEVIQFGTYNLYDKISKGGMAEIFLATSSVDSKFKLYAIKKILPIYNNDRNFIGMFNKEARIGEQLKHRNIAQIFTSGIIQNEHFLSIEFIEGLTLRQIESTYEKVSKRPPLGFSLWVISEVLKGLDYAHNLNDNHNNFLGLVHRDISPQNIMISYTGIPKILDFGIVKETEATVQTEMGVIKGKKGFMSPEQSRGQKIDHRSDLFSIGLVLIRLMSGLALIDYKSEVIQLLREDFSLYCKNEKIPFEIEDAVLTCIEENLNLRISSAAVLSKKIDSLLLKYFPSVNQEFIAKYLQATFSSHFQKVSGIVEMCQNHFNSNTVDELFSSTVIQEEESSAFKKDQSHIVAGLIPEDNFHLENTVEKPGLLKNAVQKNERKQIKITIPENLDPALLSKQNAIGSDQATKSSAQVLIKKNIAPIVSLPSKEVSMTDKEVNEIDKDLIIKIAALAIIALTLAYLVFFRS